MPPSWDSLMGGAEPLAGVLSWLPQRGGDEVRSREAVGQAVRWREDKHLSFKQTISAQSFSSRNYYS